MIALGSSLSSSSSCSYMKRSSKRRRKVLKPGRNKECLPTATLTLLYVLSAPVSVSDE